MAHEVIKDLQIPAEAHLDPVPKEVLRAYGLTPISDDPRDLLLAQVGVAGGNYEGGWFIAAYDAMRPPDLTDITTVYGAIRIHEADMPPENVFEATEDWIRESRDSVWVPGTIMQLQLARDAIQGVILVRGGGRSETPTETAPQTPEPRASRIGNAFKRLRGNTQ